MWLILAVIAGMLACSQQKDQPSTQQQNTNSAASATTANKSTATGSVKAAANPIKVCDGTGTGVATLTWSASGANRVELRIGSPDGALFAHSGPDGGTKETGRWVLDGTVVYLQDVSNGRPLTSANTIATETIKITTVGCP